MDLTEFLGVMVLGLLIFLLVQSRISAEVSGRKHNLQKIPTASNWLPIVGHALQLAHDPLTFMQCCYNRYGKLFTIRLGSKKLTLMCDRSLLKEFYSADETRFSFYTFIEVTNSDRAFSDTVPHFRVFKPVMKQAVYSRFSEVFESANQYIKGALLEWKDKIHTDNTIEVEDLMRQTYVKAIFKLLFGFEITTEICSAFAKFSDSVTLLVFASTVFHDTLTTQLFLRYTRWRRNQYVKLMLPYIEPYMKNGQEHHSIILRTVVDHTFEDIGIRRKLTDVEVCEFALALQFLMTSSPKPICYQALKELALQPKTWRHLRHDLLNTPSCHDISNNKLLHASVLEGGRLNATVMILFRSTFPHSSIAQFDLGSSDAVVVPGALLLYLDPAEDVFKDAKTFNPQRFLGENAENMDAMSIWLWGAGVHACPGRNLSLNIMKLFVANFVSMFDAEVESLSKKSYFTMSTVAVQRIKLRISPVNPKVI